MQRPARATIADVAKAAGVSKATVSRFLNHRERLLSPDIAARVEAAVAQLAYTPSPMAQALSHGRSRLIGLFVADTVFALLMAASRRVVELSTLVREGRWTKNIDEDLFGFDVHGKTLGLLGFGRIGQAIARRAALGFGMPVLYHARRAVDLALQAPELQGRAAHTPLDELLARADFVVAMLPLSDSTRGMVDAKFFAAMKPGAIFINGGRGATVQEDALLAALDHGTLRAAGLDVFATEPLPAASPLRTHPRVTPLPHIGSATHETRHAMAELATTNLLRALAGERPTAVYDTAAA